MIKVIDQPWSPLHETKKYLSEAEPLPDFLPHLEGGIEELKTTSFGCNLLTFLNEVSQLSDPNVSHNNYHNDCKDFPGDIVLATTHNTADFITQISEIHKKLNKEGCHPVGRNGIYHVIGLVKFTAYKWLNRTKFRKNEPGRSQVFTYTMPTTYSKSMAKK